MKGLSLTSLSLASITTTNNTKRRSYLLRWGTSPTSLISTAQSQMEQTSPCMVSGALLLCTLPITPGSVPTDSTLVSFSVINNKNKVNNQQVLRKKNQWKQVTIKNTSGCFQALIHCTYFWLPLLNIGTAFYWVLTSLAHDLPSVTWSVGSITRIQINLAWG